MRYAVVLRRCRSGNTGNAAASTIQTITPELTAKPYPAATAKSILRRFTVTPSTVVAHDSECCRRESGRNTGYQSSWDGGWTQPKQCPEQHGRALRATLVSVDRRSLL